MQLCLFLTFLVVTGTFSKSADGSSLPQGHSRDRRGPAAPADGLREEGARSGASESGISEPGVRGSAVASAERGSGQQSSTLTANHLRDSSNSYASSTKSLSSQSSSSSSSLLLSPSSSSSSISSSRQPQSSESESSPSDVVYATVTRGGSSQRPSLLSSLTAQAHTRAKRSLYRRSASPGSGEESRHSAVERSGSSRQKHAWKRRKFGTTAAAASEADSPAARNTSPWSSASSNSFLSSYSRSQGGSSRQSHPQQQYHHSRSSDSSESPADSASIDSFKMGDLSPDFYDYGEPSLPVAAALTSAAGSRSSPGAPAPASSEKGAAGPSPAEAFDAAGRSLARNLMVRTPRSGRRYDVPQIGEYERRS